MDDLDVRLFRSVCAVVATAFIALCIAAPFQAKTLRIASGFDPQTMNPQALASSSQRTPQMLGIEGGREVDALIIDDLLDLMWVKR